MEFELSPRVISYRQLKEKNGGLFNKEQMGAVGSQVARMMPKNYWCPA
jgi:hypothetical protein